MRAVWAEHRVRLEAGIVPVVPCAGGRPGEPVGGAGSAAPAAARALTGEAAHAAGYLLDRAGASGVVDAVVADTAARLHADVVTGDRADIARLLDAGAGVRISDV